MAHQSKAAALLFLPLLAVASIGHSQTTPEARSYLGQDPPDPSLSPDGRYLFFCGDDGNIYWADRKILDPFRTAS